MYFCLLEKTVCMHACMHAKLLQSCLTLCNPMDCSPPGSSVHGILQARILEWGAIAFSKFPDQGSILGPCIRSAVLATTTREV